MWTILVRCQEKNGSPDLHTMEFPEKLQVVQMEQLQDIMELQPDLILFVQSYPDEFSKDWFAVLRKRFPVTPCLLLARAACQGEMRTGRPLENVLRIYDYQWNPLIEKHLRLFFEKKTSLFSLPSTMGDDEFVLSLASLRSPDEPENQPDKHCIVSRFGPFGNDVAMNQLLVDLLQQQKKTVRFLHPDDDQLDDEVLIADVDDSPLKVICMAIQALKARFADSKIHLYVHSPRNHEMIELQKAGADRIFPKPFFW